MPPEAIPLRADDASLASLTLNALELRWLETAARPAISAAATTGADRKARALGFGLATQRDPAKRWA